MRLTPPPDRREALIEALAALVATHGWEPLVTGPLPRPKAPLLPSPWHAEPDAAAALLARLLGVAGLVDRPARLEIGTLADAAAEPAAVHYAGHEDGELRFYATPDALAEPVSLAGALAREVARAWRDQRGPAAAAGAADDAAADEEDVDVTAVYLGFGALTTAASHRFETSHTTLGAEGWARAEWRHRRVGVLEPVDAAWLLAVQLTLRRFPARELDRFCQGLGANPAAALRAGFRALEPVAQRLGARFGVPALAPRHAAPLPDGPPVSVIDEERRPDGGRSFNRGRPVFRFRRRRGAAGAFVGVAAAGAAAVAAAVATSYDVGPVAFALALVGGVIGYVVGNARTVDTCADPDCEALLPPDAAVCPGCGGTVAGRVRRPEDRLAAAEALEGAAAPPPRDEPPAP